MKGTMKKILVVVIISCAVTTTAFIFAIKKRCLYKLQSYGHCKKKSPSAVRHAHDALERSSDL